MFKAGNKKDALGLELVVSIYNINSGYNPDLLSRCKPLYEYEMFVELIDKYRKETGDLKKAAKCAVAECKERGILTEFIKKYASEVENMIFTQWNWDDAKRIWKEEAREDGLEEGRVKGLEEGRVKGLEEGRAKGREEGREEGRKKVIELIEKGVSADEIKRILSEKQEASHVS